MIKFVALRFCLRSCYLLVHSFMIVVGLSYISFSSYLSLYHSLFSYFSLFLPLQLFLSCFSPSLSGSSSGRTHRTPSTNELIGTSSRERENNENRPFDIERNAENRIAMKCRLRHVLSVERCIENKHCLLLIKVYTCIGALTLISITQFNN